MAPRTRIDPATEAWGIVMELLFTESPPRVPAIAAEHELSPVAVRLLGILEPGVGTPMSHLAERCFCDASNVTGIVDRMEARGLVERGEDPGDRRVKRIGLTAAGEQLRTSVRARLSEPPAEIAALPRERQEALRDVLREAFDGA